MDMTDQIRDSVRAIMDDRDISVRSLARTIDMESSNLTRILTGRSGKLPDGWTKILDALDLELVVQPKGQA